eukprot:TRINITY_DN8945_c2_g1_i3.p1 TRINITY_DN8945_c2_g1~~TRINITY_DN8945_c2_g1_i3.p1  ORF type:complete len:286 (+),score=30.31 TRINITY_DN8945_c2_g1_i3:115-858(+)
MVGVGTRGKKSVLIRVSIVSRRGKVLLDSLVKPDQEVTDWRTRYTGVDANSFAAIEALAPEPASSPSPKMRREDLLTLPRSVLSTSDAICKVNGLLENVVIVGHDLRQDLKLLGRCHEQLKSKCLLRDSAFFPLLAAGIDNQKRGGLPSLRALAESWLDDPTLHHGAHSSVEDARAAMLLYRLTAPQWESYVRKRYGEVPTEALEDRPKMKAERSLAKYSRPFASASRQRLKRQLSKRSTRDRKAAV